MYVNGDRRLPSRMLSFGSSGTCVHVALDLRFQAAGAIEFIGYVDDDPSAESERGYPVRSFEQLAVLEDVGVFVPVHHPQGRRSIFERLDAHGIPILGARGLPHLAHPDADLGEGVIVPSHTRVGHSARIGRGTIVLSDLVAHDVVIGEFATLATSTVVLGHVQIGDAVMVGAGAIIHNGTQRRPIVIGSGAMIGAGAVVDRDVAPGEIVVGPRAMSMREWSALRTLSKRTPG